MNLEKSFRIALATKGMSKQDLAVKMKCTGPYITQISKGGSMSVRDTLGGNELYSNEEILTTTNRVLFVRHPQERHISTFGFFVLSIIAVVLSI